MVGPDGQNYQGYSGAKPDGFNNPDMEGVPFTGPIPKGDYTIGQADDSVTSLTIDLIPQEGTDTYGRDNFRIHGGNGRGTASQGCIIINGRKNRQEIYDDIGGTVRVH